MGFIMRGCENPIRKAKQKSVPAIRRLAQLLAATRRKYIPVGSTSASMPPTVATSN
jgi:hypothetical protein